MHSVNMCEFARIIFIIDALLFSTASSTVSPTTVSEARFERNIDLDNLACSPADELPSVKSGSHMECAAKCLDHQMCYTIFFSMTSQTCARCSSVYNSESSQSLPGGDGNLHYQIYPICPDGWIGFLRSCYKLSAHAWFTVGADECVMEGGHAVYIETSTENEFLREFVKTDSSTWAWYVGTTDCEQTGTWRYHGSAKIATFTDFKQLDSVQERCCSLFFDMYDYQWAQFECEHPDYSFPTICEIIVL